MRFCCHFSIWLSVLTQEHVSVLSCPRMLVSHGYVSVRTRHSFHAWYEQTSFHETLSRGKGSRKERQLPPNWSSINFRMRPMLGLNKVTSTTEKKLLMDWYQVPGGKKEKGGGYHLVEITDSFHLNTLSMKPHVTCPCVPVHNSLTRRREVEVRKVCSL